MKVAIVKYNAGNTQSVVYALARLGIAPIVSDDPEVLTSADKVIFPGVGEASTAMSYLKARNLDTLIKSLTQPVLGICLGLQLLCSSSEENNAECLGVFDVPVKKFPTGKDKVPQMGWNSLTDIKGPLFKGLEDGCFVYFVHSYFAALSKYSVAATDYIFKYSSALSRDNFYAVQFHPEKSGKTGEVIIKNFLEL